jgi:lysophospholipase L1-like esterase
MTIPNAKKNKMHAASKRHLRFMAAVALVVLIFLVYGLAEPIKLHPIGDSTTNGYITEAAWRYYLYKKIVANGCDSIDFVGSIHGPTKGNTINDNDWDKDHDGHTSSKASQILNGNLARGHKGSIKEWAPKFKPHIAVIYLATNDIRGKRKTADIIETFKGIIQVLRDARGEVKIVVCQIPYWRFKGYGGSQQAVDDLNAAIPSLKDEATEISPIKIVDLNTDYAVSDHKDGIHPGPTGAVKIADRVYEAIAPWLFGSEKPAKRQLHAIHHSPIQKKGLNLTLQGNRPALVWISTEPGGDIRKGRRYSITGRKISAP